MAEEEDFKELLKQRQELRRENAKLKQQLEGYSNELAEQNQYWYEKCEKLKKENEHLYKALAEYSIDRLHVLGEIDE